LFLLLGLNPAPAQTPPATTNAPAFPRALPVNPADLNVAPAPMAVAGGVNVHWYGHGFVYLTSSVGIRCAIDPFGPDTVHYKFPRSVSIAPTAFLFTASRCKRTRTTARVAPIRLLR